MPLCALQEGKTYEDQRGPYVVISEAGEKARIRYELDSVEVTVVAEIKWQIHQHISEGRKLGMTPKWVDVYESFFAAAASGPVDLRISAEDMYLNSIANDLLDCECKIEDYHIAFRKEGTGTCFHICFGEQAAKAIPGGHSVYSTHSQGGLGVSSKPILFEMLRRGWKLGHNEPLDGTVVERRVGDRREGGDRRRVVADRRQA